MIIVGGLAAARTAQELRRNGRAGRILSLSPLTAVGDRAKNKQVIVRSVVPAGRGGGTAVAGSVR